MNKQKHGIYYTPLKLLLKFNQSSVGCSTVPVDSQRNTQFWILPFSFDLGHESRIYAALASPVLEKRLAGRALQDSGRLGLQISYWYKFWLFWASWDLGSEVRDLEARV